MAVRRAMPESEGITYMAKCIWKYLLLASYITIGLNFKNIETWNIIRKLSYLKN